MKIIEKKILPGYYEEVRKQTKTFELRKDDADYQVGDTLVLCEWTGTAYTGRTLEREITYILRDCYEFGLAPGYCILAIQPVGWNDPTLHPSDFAVLDGDGT